ncbi:MAG: XRE family transcriptional regulator [Terriglobales bacterium]
MISQTITDGLKPYGIGEKIRALRLKKSMGLVELGKHTGLSAAMLSKLERGKLFPTLPTLLRIALVFSVGLEFFFTDERKRRVVAVVRKKDRVRFPERPGTADVSYFFECLDYPATERKFNAFLAEFQDLPPERTKSHHHPGVEFLYLVNGTLDIKVGSQDFTLETGDSIYFDSAVQHSYRRSGKKPCEAVIVTLP